MARRRSRSPNELNVWPAFVDVLATLLLVIILLVLIVTLTQFYTASRANRAELVGDALTQRVLDQNELLALQSGQIGDLETARASLSARLNTQLAELNVLSSERDAALASAEDLLLKLAQADDVDAILEGSLADAFTQMDEKLDRLLQVLAAVESENTALLADNTALTTQVDGLNTSLDDLGERINDALILETEELQRQRSLFFGTLIDVLGERDEVSVVGDRFVFQSEVLFDSGSADLGRGGQQQLAQLATTILEIAEDFPPELDWILRIDGHTDARPIGPDSDSGFQNNWQLSSERARSVVEYLIARGVPPQRLTAAGFGEFQPLVPGGNIADLARNRRIEIKLTTR